MSDDLKEQWKDFLNPEVMREHLISASIYIAAYESLLKEAIIGRPKEMYTNGWNIEEGDTVGLDYKANVLSRKKNVLLASFDWLRECGAVDDADVARLERINECRNHLAHRLLDFLGKEGMVPNFRECFEEMIELISKIERWWIINVEMAVDPDICQEDVDLDGIVPGKLMTLQLMCDIALGSDDVRKYYYEEFNKRFGKQSD